MKKIIFLFFFVTNIYASEIRVLGENSYTLNISKGILVIKGHLIDLSIQRDKCNAYLIDRFNLKFKEEMNKWPMKKHRSSIRYIYDGVEYYESSKSERGRYLLAIPGEIRQLKMEEKLLKCN